MDQFRLDNKIALITGAGSGLGKQFAFTLAEAGATVVLAARRREKLEEAAAAIRDAGGTAHCVDLDVTDSTSIAKCFAEMHDSVGVADIVVNNAGSRGRRSWLILAKKTGMPCSIQTSRVCFWSRKRQHAR